MMKSNLMENSLDFGSRSIYDGRIARFFSHDPDEHKYPWQSTYAYSGNSPVVFVDNDGRGYTIKIYSPYVSSVLRQLPKEELTLQNIQNVLDDMKANFTEEEAAWVNKVLSDAVTLPPENKTSTGESDGVDDGKISFFALDDDGNMEPLASFKEEVPPVKEEPKDIIDRVIDALYEMERPKSREATAFEKWLYERMDQSEISKMTEMFGYAIGRKANNTSTPETPDSQNMTGGNTLTGLGQGKTGFNNKVSLDKNDKKEREIKGFIINFNDGTRDTLFQKKHGWYWSMASRSTNRYTFCR